MCKLYVIIGTVEDLLPKMCLAIILVDSKIIDHSDVVGAGPVGAAPTTSSFST